MKNNIKINSNFQNIKVTVGTRWTTGFDTTTNAQKPDKNGKVIPTQNATLYDVVEQMILNENYRKTCERLASEANAKLDLTKPDTKMKSAKEFARAVFAFSDYRYTKYDNIVIDGKQIKQKTNKAYLEHTGLMGFDIDFPKDTPNLQETIMWLKEGIHKKLSVHKWYCMTTLSTGGKGIHIYTYNEVPIEYSKTEPETSPRIAYFDSCYQYKSYFVYKALFDLYREKQKHVSFDFIFTLLDFAMYKPEQPLNVTVFDNEPLINDSFECEICMPVVKNIDKGYTNWIHTENGVQLPEHEAGYELFTSMYRNISKFKPHERYSYEHKGVYIKNDQYMPKKIGGDFYFGHNERHFGIPTLHEICKYLLATRNYDDAKYIVSREGFYWDQKSSKLECVNNICRLLDWYASLNVEFAPSQYVCDWLNKYAGFKDKLEWNELSDEIVNIADGFVKDSKGKIINTDITNYKYYLNNYPKYKGKLKYNIFSCCNEWTGKSFSEGEAVDYSMRDIDMTMIRNDFNRHMHFLSKNLVEDALDEVCNENKYNPVVDYLNSLEWDGVERIHSMFTDWLGAENNVLYSQYAKIWMHAAVKRVFQPGCKFDNVLILSGKQGDGKTEFFKRLGKKWNTSNKINLSNKDYINKLNKAWLVIMDEMAGLNKKEMDEVKAFFSNQDDDDRLAFKKENEKYYRHCIFCGTTNKKEMLRDTDDIYERRFWMIPIDVEDQTYVYRCFTEEEVDKLWAEAVYKYKQDPEMSLYLGLDFINMAKEEQIQYKAFNNDDTLPIIEEILEKEYVFSADSPTYHGLHYFTDYEEFKKQAFDDKIKEVDNVAFVKQKLGILQVKFLKMYLNDVYKEARSPKWICSSLLDGNLPKFEYKQIKVNGVIARYYNRLN